MKLAELLRKLAEKIGVVVESEITDPASKKTTRVLVGKLPPFPHASGPTWYALILPKDQDYVESEEVSAILRHFWQLQKEDEFIKDD